MGASQNADHEGLVGPHVPLIIFSRHERPAIGRTWTKQSVGVRQEKKKCRLAHGVALRKRAGGK